MYFVLSMLNRHLDSNIEYAKFVIDVVVNAKANGVYPNMLDIIASGANNKPE